MNRYLSEFIRFIKRKEFPVYIVFLIALMSLTGWLSGKLDLASFSLSYIPIAPINVLILLVLTSVFLIRIKTEKSRSVSILTTGVILLVMAVCLFILIIYILGFSLDIEKIIVKNPEKLGNVVIGRISPISDVLLIFICIGILGLEAGDTRIVKYAGGSISMLVAMISSVLIIGYLYRAPLLYGSKIIPVSLPSAISFFLLSTTLTRLYGFRYWTFNLIKDNKIRHLLLKSFLPVVVVIIVIQGFLDTVWSFNDINPPLTGAIVLLLVIVVTTITVYRVSTIIGAQLLKAETLLKESEAKFRSTMEHSADSIFITDKNGKYIYVNHTALDMLGYTFEELTSKTFADISPPGKLEEYFEIFREILGGNGKVFTEIELLKKDGEFLVTDLSAVLLPDGTVYGSCRDITQRKSDEKKVRDLNQKLSELNADKDRFMAILGHDLKSPFNHLLGLSQILIDDLSKLKSEDIAGLADDINSTAQKTYSLLDDILMWARIQQGRIPFNPQEVSLKDICKEILDLLLIQADKKNIAIYQNCHDDILVSADPDMLKTILRNLFSNAVKFTGHNGSVSISAVKTGKKVLISVSDSGVGIDLDNLPKLFDITEVFSTTGTDGESGTGLGLLLCKEFVEKHGGSIWVESETGKGSKFSFTI